MYRPDPELTRLNEERDHAAIQVSLAWDASPPDLVRLSSLQRKLDSLDVQIHRFRPAEG